VARIIKFRGLSVNGEWRYGYLSVVTSGMAVKVETGSYISNKGGAPFAYQVRPETVGQFTELHDCESTEIYEGDILEVTGDCGDVDIVQVKYHGDHNYPAFDTVPEIGCDTNGLSYAIAACVVMVIGNVYEHPELLPTTSTEPQP